VTQPLDDRTRTKDRQRVRLDVLKRRVTIASTLGFAALFGLAAQHAVKGASAATSRTSTTRASAAAAAPTTYFDEGNGFSFGTTDSQQSNTQSQVSSPPPVAQTSVS
jgi:hypothetical protein